MPGVGPSRGGRLVRPARLVRLAGYDGRTARNPALVILRVVGEAVVRWVLRSGRQTTTRRAQVHDLQNAPTSAWLASPPRETPGPSKQPNFVFFLRWEPPSSSVLDLPNASGGPPMLHRAQTKVQK